MTCTTSPADRLRAFVGERAEAPAAAWFHGALEAAAVDGDGLRFRVAFARAGRMLGSSRAEVPAVERPAEAGPDWSLRDYGRASLLLAFLGADPAPHRVDAIEALLRSGDLGEQQSVLRALPILPGPERFVALAIHACRTNAVDVFAAIAHDNPFAARHFPAASFNQLVLKALFVGLPVERIEGLRERVDPELVAMVRDYASERRAAGRPVPDDVSRIESMMEAKRS